jgi:hypothetical protein
VRARAPRDRGRTDIARAGTHTPTANMAAPMYNTIPAADAEPLVQTKAAPTTSIKKLIFAAAAASFVLGAVSATVVAPKSAVGAYQFSALEKCGPQHQCSADGCTCYSGNAPCSQAGLTCPSIICPNGSCQCGNQPVRQAGLEVLFTILAASTQRESAWRPRTRRPRLTHPNV